MKSLCEHTRQLLVHSGSLLNINEALEGSARSGESSSRAVPAASANMYARPLAKRRVHELVEIMETVCLVVRTLGAVRLERSE